MTGMVPFTGGLQARIYLYNLLVDMRRSFDGLMAIVQAEFAQDIRQGDLFLFINRRRNRIKILWWDDDGLAIFMKRLEQGTFERPANEPDDKHLEMDRTALSLLLSFAEFFDQTRFPAAQLRVPIANSAKACRATPRRRDRVDAASGA